jgi:hypothetical protein
MSETYCPVCGSAGARIEQRGDSVDVECNRCARFQMTGSLRSTLSTDSEFIALRPFLSAHLRQSSERGEPSKIGTHNWKMLTLAHRRTTVNQKLDRLLEVLGKRSATAGTEAHFGPDDFVLVDAADNGEAEYLLSALQEQGLIRGSQTFQGGFVVTPSGWDRLAPHLPGGIPGTCFVAMSFHPSMDAAFNEGILAAAETDCGYRAIRVDREPHNDNITDRIIAGIREAQFVIADFTRQRQGVYYEAGFTVGLGRPVIRTCQDTDFDQLHFDTRQFNHLKWSTPADLRVKLRDHIRATMGTRR